MNDHRSDAQIGYALHRSRAHPAVIRVYDDAGNVIETHEHAVGSCDFLNETSVESQNPRLTILENRGSTPRASSWTFF
jgi:hypothetical protein